MIMRINIGITISININVAITININLNMNMGVSMNININQKMTRRASDDKIPIWPAGSRRAQNEPPEAIYESFGHQRPEELKITTRP